MKILRTILASLVLVYAVVANAEAEQAWIRVDGGSWTPGTETISRIKSEIEPFVRSKVLAEGRKLRHWDTYIFQYQGQEENGRKYVFVNALCIKDKRWQLNKQMILVLDGGTCFFNLRYDPDKNQFFNLIINGEA